MFKSDAQTLAGYLRAYWLTETDDDWKANPFETDLEPSEYQDEGITFAHSPIDKGNPNTKWRIDVISTRPVTEGEFKEIVGEVRSYAAAKNIKLTPDTMRHCQIRPR